MQLRTIGTGRDCQAITGVLFARHRADLIKRNGGGVCRKGPAMCGNRAGIKPSLTGGSRRFLGGGGIGEQGQQEQDGEAADERHLGSLAANENF